MPGRLEDALTARLNNVLARHETTEPELRRLAEEGDALRRLLSAELVRREARLEMLTAEPDAPLGEIADELRRVRDLKTRLATLDAQLSDLDAEARSLRASWVGRR
jgi:hypothetical protein